MPNTRTGRWIVALAVVTGLAAAPAAAGKKKLKTLSSAEDFKALVGELLPEAEKFAASGGDAAPAAHPAVANVRYGPADSEALGQALLARQKLPLARLYVAYQLLQPLDTAGDEQLAKLRTSLLRVFALCKYRRMPVWPKYKLQQLVLPKRKMPKLMRQQREEARRKFLAEKTAKEQAVVKHNRTACAIQKTLKVLLIRMRQPQADTLLLTRLAEEDDGRWSTYQTTLEGIRAEAVHMKQKQAKRHYDGLLGLFRQSKQKRHYADPTHPKYSQTDNSSFQFRQGWFAQEAAKVINLVSTSAREPAVIVPQDKKRRRPRRRGR